MAAKKSKKQKSPGLVKCRTLSPFERTRRRILTEFRRIKLEEHSTSRGETEFKLFGRLIAILNALDKDTKLVVMILKPDQKGFCTFNFYNDRRGDLSGIEPRVTAYNDHAPGLQILHYVLLETLTVMAISTLRTAQQTRYGHWRFAVFDY